MLPQALPLLNGGVFGTAATQKITSIAAWGRIIFCGSAVFAIKYNVML